MKPETYMYYMEICKKYSPDATLSHNHEYSGTFMQFKFYDPNKLLKIIIFRNETVFETFIDFDKSDFNHEIVKTFTYSKFWEYSKKLFHANPNFHLKVISTDNITISPFNVSVSTEIAFSIDSEKKQYNIVAYNKYIPLFLGV